ncbi:MAG: LPS export ABC transporter periplasmic protein LptC [Hyphomicrobiales bacterium]|nr:LPS export ABC transporter periplasmic protein LptC [Hyphomicrobiales bacterium]
MSEAPSQPHPRAQAFADAKRHSARVHLARRLLLLGVGLGAAGLVVVSVYNPLPKVPATVAVKALGLDGSKVIIKRPRMTGYRNDGRAYAVSALSGVQDVKNPNLIDLATISAKFAMADKSSALLLAPKGHYDAKTNLMHLSGGISLDDDAGYKLRMRDAVVDLKTSAVDSAHPAHLVTTTGSIRGDSLHVSDNGNVVTFVGNVVSIMQPGPTNAPAGGEPKP